jgi:cytochrome o ubiquinol oxidase subunit 1
MGMPRRLQHYNNPAWHPYLIIAAIGTAVILCGIIFMIVQLIVSILERESTRDLSGDLWDGRTLEWATSSPPPVYNFAVIPEVHDIDAFTDMKEKETAYKQPEKYQDIHMPKNTASGLVVGALSFIFGFAMIWHIWWLVITSALAILFTIILRASNDDIHYIITADEVEQMENERFRQLAMAAGKAEAD